MAQILIRNIDAAVIEAVRRRAADCGTSTEEQAQRALARAVKPASRSRFATFNVSIITALGRIPPARILVTTRIASQQPIEQAAEFDGVRRPIR